MGVKITRGKHCEKNGTKTETSKATFPLLPDVKEALLIRKQVQDRNRAEFGEAYVENDYVFTNDDGSFLRQPKVMEKFKKILSACDLPYMRMHDLRHSTASILYARGWDLKDIQMWIRHADSEVTANIYTHIKENFTSDVPEYLQNVFEPTPKPKATVLKADFGHGKMQ